MTSTIYDYRSRRRIGRGCTTGTHRTEFERGPDRKAWHEIDVERARVLTPGAEWEAGTSPDHDKFRILLNGEPVVGAVAASYRAGWVDFIFTRSAYDDAEFVTERRRLHGYVEIVPDLCQ